MSVIAGILKGADFLGPRKGRVLLILCVQCTATTYGLG